MNDVGGLNFAWAQSLIAGFAAAGVRRAVISPGARSTPLTLALLRRPEMACEMMVDERSAAFFALGLAKAECLPVLLVATSGSAPANWLPAVVEAGRAGVPLILLAADRPPELHDCGANQSIDQLALFGSQVRARHALEAPHPGFSAAWLHRLAARVVEESLAPLPGPVHVNQPFREPLLPAEIPPAPALPPPLPIRRAAPAVTPEALADLARRISGQPGAIVCGGGDYPAGFAAAVAALAARLDCPILAEPASGLRFGGHDRSRVLCRYEGWLRDGEFVAAHRPRWLLRFGDFPVTRSLQGFVAAAERVVVADPWPRWNDAAHACSEVLRADPLAVCAALQAAEAAPEGWLAAYAAAEARAAAALAPDGTSFEGNLVPALLAALPAGCPLFVGNSMAIRDVDAFGGGGAKPLEIFANRGASGIDGNVSTALGIAAARGRVVALLGDLTCQHDLGGLAAARGRDALLVVLNNGGGGIFEYLPPAALPEFEAGWLTPQTLDFAAAARAFGLAYRTADRLETFKAACSRALAAGGPCLLEARIDRRASVTRREAWLEAASGRTSRPAPR